MKYRKLIYLLALVPVFGLFGCKNKNEHIHIFDQEIVNEQTLYREADCSNKASYYKTCECGEVSKSAADTFTYGDYVHTDILQGYNNESHYHFCTCGYEFNDNEAHTLKEETTISTNYDHPGEIKYSCEKCDYSYVEEVPQLVHSYSDTLSSNETHHYYACLDEGYEDLKYHNEQHNFALVGSVKPTCGEEGSSTYKCQVCDYEKVEAISATNAHNNVGPCVAGDDGYCYQTCSDCGQVLEKSKTNHDYEVVSSKANDCENDGYENLKCKNCGYETSRNLPKDETKHNFALVESVKPTCGEEGSSTYKCQVCDYEKVEVIPATNAHNNLGSCVTGEDGYCYQTCSDCGQVLENSKTNHDYEVISSKANDCVSDGYENLKCKNCGYEITKNLPKDETKHNYQIKFNDDSHYEECSICHKIEKTTPHDLKEISRVDATCDKEGSINYSCECGYTKTEPISKIDHVLGDYIVEENGHYQECTKCETYGKEESFEEHSFVVKSHKDSTCLKEGQEVSECSKCGYTKTTTLPLADHTPKDGYNDIYHFQTCSVCEEILALSSHHYELVDKVEPTCSEDGSTTYICSGCDYEETRIILKTGEHTFYINDGGYYDTDKHTKTCEFCGLTEKEPHVASETYLHAYLYRYTVCKDCGRIMSSHYHTINQVCEECGFEPKYASRYTVNVNPNVYAGSKYDLGATIIKDYSENEIDISLYRVRFYYIDKDGNHVYIASSNGEYDAVDASLIGRRIFLEVDLKVPHGSITMTNGHTNDAIISINYSKNSDEHYDRENYAAIIRIQEGELEDIVTYLEFRSFIRVQGEHTSHTIGHTYDNDYHYGYCIYCGETYDKEAHDLTYKTETIIECGKNDIIKSECICGYHEDVEGEMSFAEHDYIYHDYGSNMHDIECKNCPYTGHGYHKGKEQYVDEKTCAYTCSLCGHLTTRDHIETNIYYDSTSHYYKCRYCEDLYKKEAHDFQEVDGIIACTICERQQVVDFIEFKVDKLVYGEIPHVSIVDKTGICETYEVYEFGIYLVETDTLIADWWPGKPEYAVSRDELPLSEEYEGQEIYYLLSLKNKVYSKIEGLPFKVIINGSEAYFRGAMNSGYICHYRLENKDTCPSIPKMNNASVDFKTDIEDFSKWTNAYVEHSVTKGDVKVDFSSADRQTSTITNMPVTKGGEYVVSVEGGDITSFKATFEKWTTKSQNVTILYSLDGDNYVETSIKGVNAFTEGGLIVDLSSIEGNVQYIKVTFSSTSNQIGLDGIEVSYYK